MLMQKWIISQTIESFFSSQNILQSHDTQILWSASKIHKVTQDC